MSPIQAKNQPYLNSPALSFWVWAAINIIVPVIGILFLDWGIFGVIYLFYFELFCQGAVGVLMILSASGAGSLIGQITTRIEGLIYFVPLYFALLLLVVSFSFVEINTADVLITGGTTGLGISLILIVLNYLARYVKEELMSGIWTVRKPIDVLFTRFFYALPLACLVLFAVVPLAQRFEEVGAAKIIALGIVIAKGTMDILAVYLPNIMLVEVEKGMREEEIVSRES